MVIGTVEPVYMWNYQKLFFFFFLEHFTTFPASVSPAGAYLDCAAGTKLRLSSYLQKICKVDEVKH